MSTTSQYTDFSDLYTGLQNRVREQTGVTATENQAKRYINIALHDMHIGNGEKFPWAEREAVLVTQDDYTTGTLSVNQGSTSLTGSGTAWNTNNAFSVANMRAGGKIVIDAGVETYTISAVGGDTSATLSSAYTQSDASAVSYVYFEDEYALASDFLRPLDLHFFDQNQSVELIGRREFRHRYPRNHTVGKPVTATIVDKTFGSNTTPVRKVRLHKPPDDFYSIPYSYVTSNLAVSAAGSEQANLSADTDEPIVPLRYRHAILLHALFNWYRDKKDDTRGTEVRQEYTDLMLRIMADFEIGHSKPQFRPRLSAYSRAATRPYSGRGGRYVTGTRFDEFR